MSTQVVRVVQGPTKVVVVPRAVGSPGPQGEPGPAGESAYDAWLAQGNVGTEAEFLASLVGPPGADGQDGQPGADGAPGPAGEDGTAGSDGRAVALRTAAGFVQWQYAGDPGWTNLIALADLTGPRGDDGTDGTNGADGKSVELRISGGYIQWRQTDGAWGNLVTLTAITGPAGEDGAPGAPGADGADGAPGADGVSPDLTIGTVTTGDPGTPAAAAIGGTFPDLHLDLTIPRGADGTGGGGGGSDADTAGWVADEESLTRAALDAAFVGSDTIRRIVTTTDPDEPVDPDTLLVVLPVPRVVAVAHSDQTYGGADSVSSVSAVVPAGVAAGDMLIALLGHSPYAITAPAGWSLVSSGLGPGSQSATGLIGARSYTRTATGTESGMTVTFTQATAGRMSLALLVVRSGTGSVAVAGQGSASYASAAANPGLHPIPAVTATGRGMLAVTVGVCALTTTTGNSTITHPSGWDALTPLSVPSTPTSDRLRMWAASKALAAGESTAGVSAHAPGTTHDGATLVLLLEAV